MASCKKCQSENSVMHFDLCEKCHAFSVFDENPPTNEVLERIKNNKCIPCGNNFLYPVDAKPTCGYCQLVKKYHSLYLKSKS